MTEGRTQTGASADVTRETSGGRLDPARDEGASRVGLQDTHHQTPPTRRDRVRWGPVWAGLIVAVPTFLLLQLATLALGWWDMGGGDGNNADLISGINGLLALFLGGLTAGATALWRGVSEGLLHGILVWALTVVTIVLLTLFGGGALLGSLAGVVTDVAGIQQANLPDIQAGQAAETARSAASWAVLGLGLSIIASALGGVIGAKMWPGKQDTEVVAR
ncbi:permease [Blastococcus sp. SYSU DS0753]